MHFSKIAFAAAVAATVLAVAIATLDLTLAAAGTTYVLTSAQLSAAVAGLAGIAVAKKALYFAHLHDQSKRRRFRRDADMEASKLSVDFAPLFEGIVKTDVADCGKLVVCHAMAKDEQELTSEERLILELFPQEAIQENAYGEYQWAAYAGSFKHPEICTSKYSKCTVSLEELSNLVNIKEQ